MKKLLAILLALLMALTLFACGGKDDPGKTPSPAPSGGNGGSENEWPAVAGFFDPEYDYTQHKKYKVSYMVTSTNFLYDEFDKAFADWAKRMNINYTGMWAPAGGSADEYLSAIATFADQGYDGLLLDGDSNLYARAVEVCNDVGITWISCMSQARDYASPYMMGDAYIPGQLFGPNVGFNNTQFGIDMIDKLEEWRLENYPDVPIEKVGVISITYSVAVQLFERATGAEMRWAELHPELGAYDPDPTKNPTNFYIADTISGSMDQVTAQNLVTQIMSNPKGVEVWLISAAFDDFAMGAANAAENLGLTDKTCAVCIGGSNLALQWDSGVENAWRYAQFTAQSIYAEPIICGLWALMSGQATPDTLWPEWVVSYDKGDVFKLSEDKDPVFGVPYVEVDEDGKAIVIEEHNYASLLLPTQWLDKETYQTYLEWTDLFAYGADVEGHYKYDPVTDLSMFSARAEVPESYNVYPTLAR